MPFARSLSCAVHAAAMFSAACARPAPEARPQSADSGLVSVPGARLFYRSVGRGDPILVVHGGPGMDHTYLLPGMLGLAKHNRIVFYDQRGSGRTEGEVSGETVSFDRFLTDIDAIRDSLRLDRMVLLGHSWGGVVAMRYAAKYPTRLKALVLMNTGEPGRRYAEQSARLLRSKQTPEDSAEIARLVQLPAMAQRDTGVINPLFRVMFRPTFSNRTLADRLAINLDPRTAKNMSAVATLVMGPFATADFWNEAADIRVPTLIVQGADDAMPIAMLRDLAQTIPNAELRIIDGAGHFPYIEKPEQTFAMIRSFAARSGALPAKVPFTIRPRP